MAHRGAITGGNGRGGFTLVEVLFSILVIFLLMGLLLAGFHYAMKSAHKVMGRQTASAVKMAVNQFQDQFHFTPPLVKDMGEPPNFSPLPPLIGTPPTIPRVYALSTPADLSYLRGTSVTMVPDRDLRFSVYSLAYYIMGVLDKDADGVAGPGFTEPTRDGGFTRKGPAYGPYFDVGRNERAVYAIDAAAGRIELRDDNGVALRYYRWEHLAEKGATPSTPINDYLHVPLIVGDPEADPDLRSAKWAIVAAGRDGVFGDEHLLPTGHPQQMTKADLIARLNIDPSTNPTNADIRAVAMKDNAVEVGR